MSEGNMLKLKKYIESKHLTGTSQAVAWAIYSVSRHDYAGVFEKTKGLIDAISKNQRRKELKNDDRILNEEISEHLRLLVKEVTQAYGNHCVVIIPNEKLTAYGECPKCNNDDLMGYHERHGNTYELEEFFDLILELGKA